MLTSFYLELKKYIHGKSSNFDFVTKKYEAWQDNHTKWMNEKNTIQEKYLINNIQPKTEFDKKCELLSEENKQYKTDFENSNTETQKANFERWVKFQDHMIIELINILQE